MSLKICWMKVAKAAPLLPECRDTAVQIFDQYMVSHMGKISICLNRFLTYCRPSKLLTMRSFLKICHTWASLPHVPYCWASKLIIPSLTFQRCAKDNILSSNNDNIIARAISQTYVMRILSRLKQISCWQLILLLCPKRRQLSLCPNCWICGTMTCTSPY